MKDVGNYSGYSMEEVTLRFLQEIHYINVIEYYFSIYISIIITQQCTILEVILGPWRNSAVLLALFQRKREEKCQNRGSF